MNQNQICIDSQPYVVAAVLQWEQMCDCSECTKNYVLKSNRENETDYKTRTDLDEVAESIASIFVVSVESGWDL